MKDVKKLFLPLIVLGLLILALVVYLVVDGIKKKSVEENYGAKSYSVFETANIQKMEILSSKGETTVFEFDGNDGVTACSHNGSSVELNQLDQNAVYDYLGQFAQVSVVRQAASGQIDTSLYGLDKDSYTVTLTQKDGKTNVLHFGKPVEDESGIFFRLDDEDKVSIVKYYYYQKLSSEFENLLDVRVISLERLMVSNITLTRASRNDKIVVAVVEEKNTSVISTITYKVVEPVETTPKTELISLMDKILDFRVTQYLNIPKEEYASYGLDNPAYTFTVKKTSGETIDIYLSREINGMYYGYSSNSTSTFKVLSSYLTGLELPINELFETYIKRGYLDTISSVTVVLEGKKFEMEIQLDKTTKDIMNVNSMLSVNKRDARVVSSDGQVCYGLMLFDSICNMRYSDYDKQATPELKDPVLSMQFYTVNRSTYTVKLVQRDEQTYYCFINDEYSGFIADRSVIYKDNGRYLTGFGVKDAYNLCNEAIDNQDLYGVYDRPSAS